eukprot:5342297-Prymnesium_polylepis.1
MEYGIQAPLWEHYINKSTETDRNGMLQRIVDETQVSRVKAKQLPVICLTDGKKIRTSSPYLKQAGGR